MQIIENLGRRVLEKRADKGIREAAKEIGVSHGTLSRIERGFMPDMHTYKKICDWLGEDLPAPTPIEGDLPEVHFRKAPTVSPELATALAELILYAQRQMHRLQQG
ncbi:MAG: XRE family transcriptional regulator [Sphingobacteriales bacterium]|nr:MAG: XRE family transcriptional regulator [Sphingobacteriales bacterium]